MNSEDPAAAADLNDQLLFKNADEMRKKKSNLINGSHISDSALSGV